MHDDAQEQGYTPAGEHTPAEAGRIEVGGEARLTVRLGRSVGTLVALTTLVLAARAPLPPLPAVPLPVPPLQSQDR